MASSKVMSSSSTTSRNPNRNNKIDAIKSLNSTPPPLDLHHHHRLFRTTSSNNYTSRGEVFNNSAVAKKTVEDVWNEIVAGNIEKGFKEEARDGDDDDDDDNDVMTLEDFLAKAEAIDDEEEVKMPPPLPFSFDSGPISPFQVGTSVDGGFEIEVNDSEQRGKRRASVLESLDKVTQQRQRRMIKNRESAARSRERKQAYLAELEAVAVKLEEENEQLLKEKAQLFKDRYKLLMEKVVPILQKQKTVRVLRRVRSLQW